MGMNNDARHELQEALIRKIQEGSATSEDRLQLYRSMERFCESVANKYRSALRVQEEHKPLEPDDLLQEAYIALQEAAETFDPDAGASFSGWLAFYLHTAFNRLIAEENGISRGVHERQRKIRHFEAEYEAKNGRKPTDEAICRALGIGLETMQKLRQAGSVTSLDAEIGEDLTMGDMVEDPEDMESKICDRIVMGEVRKKLREYLEELAADEREAVILYFYRGMSVNRCAQFIGITYGSFRRRLESVVRHVGSSRHKRELGRYLPERFESMAYRRPNPNRWVSSTEKTAIMLICRNHNNENQVKGETQNGD